jgi:hypothetical protein
MAFKYGAKDWEGEMQIREVKGKLVKTWSFDNAASIHLVKQGRNKFAVCYGLEINQDMEYSTAATNLGHAMLHAMNCVAGTMSEVSKEDIKAAFKEISFLKDRISKLYFKMEGKVNQDGEPSHDYDWAHNCVSDAMDCMSNAFQFLKRHVKD